MNINDIPGNKIELGGGNNPVLHPNVDVRAGEGIDIVADFNKPLDMLKSNEYDFVYSRYAIEHISWRSVKQFVSEVARILKPGGSCYIITANLKEQARVIANIDVWEGDYESRLLFGGQDYGENTHSSGMSPEYAIRLFSEYGIFAEIQEVPGCATDMIIAGKKSPPDRFHWLRNQLPSDAEHKVIDIGCSDAAITWKMTNVTWVDSEPYETLVASMVKFNRIPFPREKFIQVMAEELPFDNKSFDTAIASEILEHVKDPIKVLQEINRIANRIVISVPNEYEWASKWAPFTNPMHVRHYTKSMLENDIIAAGFTKYEIGQLDYEGWSFITAVVEGIPTELVRTNYTQNNNNLVMTHVNEVVTHSGIADALSQIRMSDRKLRVGLISTRFFGVPPKGYSGLEAVVYDIAVGLSKLGHEVTLFAPEGSQAPPNGKLVTTGKALQTTNVDWLQSEVEAYNVYSSLLNTNSFDIIHSNDWFGLSYLSKTNNRALKVCHTHHGHLNTNFWKTNTPFKLNMIAISKHMMDEYKQQGFTSRFVYNGIDLDRYPYQAEKGDRLLFVGRLSPMKQPHIAIELAKKLGVGLDIVGGTFVADNEKDYLKGIIAAGDNKQIVVYPDATHELKMSLMQSAKALIFPSNMGEPFGLVAAESMACGTPVISTADGAIGEVVQDGVTGFICKDINAMVSAYHGLVRISTIKCRERVEKMFSRDSMAKEYESLYNDIIAGKEW